MRFSKKIKLNAILKITFKSVFLGLIILSVCLELGRYISDIKIHGWIFDWNGRVSVYGDSVGLFVSNYFLSYSTLILVTTALYLLLAIIRHSYEAKGKIQTYPVGLFLVLAQLFNMVSFFAVVLPTADHINGMAWESITFTKIIIPILTFIYVMVLMENKSWYGVRETMLRIGFNVFLVFCGMIVFYWLIWLSKYVGEPNNNVLTLEYTKEGDLGQAIKELTNISDKEFDRMLPYLRSDWNNHDVLNGDILFHFSNSESAFFGVGEWIGIVFAFCVFVLLSFGVTPLLAMLNKVVVNSPKYIVVKEAKINDGIRTVDLRGEVDTIDFGSDN